MPLALLAACGLPTDVPKSPILDLRWVVPSQSTRITVDNLLPLNGAVKVLLDSSGFSVTVPAASVTRSLSQDCAPCVAANGLVAPKPAFIVSTSTSTALPAEIVSSTLLAGGANSPSLRVTVNNGYTFDPLYPNPSAGTPTGSAVITVSNGSTVLGRDSVNGATTRLPAGGTLTRNIPLSGTISGSSPVTVSFTVNSPAGEPVLIDASRSLTVTATPLNINVASTSVTVTNRAVSSSSTIDLAGVDSTISKRVQNGSLILSIVNPFNVTGALTVKLTPQGGAAIAKQVTLAPNNSTVTISLTGPELRSLLGHSVLVSYTGAVNATGPVNVSPRQAVVVTTRLDVALQVGG